MKQAIRFAGSVLCFSLFAMSMATAQVKYNEGPVERVVLIDILPGHFDAFMDDLKTNIVPIWQAEKEAGLIQDYQMFLNQTANGPDDWSFGFAITYKNMAALDGLADKVIPELVRNHPAGQPLRIWIAGCSTGEETYSLAILFREEITATKSGVKLQVFASDVDPDAVDLARAGLYPESIEADVSPSRLERFFIKEGHGYRASPELRGAVVFTVQDVLADPPFSRLDLVSCRNLLIYLGSEAQARVISIFHFALREGGILLLGGSETIANAAGRFEAISKSERLFRRIGRNRPGEFGFSRVVAGPRANLPTTQEPPPLRQAALASGPDGT